MLFDSHCHIQFQGYQDDRNEVILRCRQKGVKMNAVGTQKNTSKLAVELAEANEDIYATIGLHPIHLHATQVDEEESSFLSHEENFDEVFYDELAKSKKVIAVGECGLELYHLPEGVDKEKILEKQKEIFIQQYNFALKHGLPLVIHVRDAYEEQIQLLQFLPLDKGRQGGVESLSTAPALRVRPSLSKEGNRVEGVIHCYSGNWQQAQKFLDMGFYIGFTGVITFPARKTNPQPTLDLLEVVEKCPLDRILIETDAPYLAPQAYRGKKCEPWMVEEVVKEIAKIKHLSRETVEETVYQNTLNLFTKIVGNH